MADFFSSANDVRMVANVYTTLRTLTTQTAEAAAPVAAAFTVSLQTYPFVDVLIAPTAAAGTVAADTIVWKIWRLIGSNVELLQTYYQPVSAVATAFTVTTKLATDKMWVTVDFLGGTSPNVSAVIYVRPIFDAALTKSDLLYDASGSLKIVPPSYDSAANADRSFSINDVSDKWSYETPCDLTSTNVVTAVYDIDCRGWSSIYIHISATSGTAGSVKFSINSIADISAASPTVVPVSVSGFNLNTNSFLAPSDMTTQDITVGLVNEKYRIDYTDFGSCVCRISVTASSHANNVLKIVVAKKY